MVFLSIEVDVLVLWLYNMSHMKTITCVYAYYLPTRPHVMQDKYVNLEADITDILILAVHL